MCEPGLCVCIASLHGINIAKQEETLQNCSCRTALHLANKQLRVQEEDNNGYLEKEELRNLGIWMRHRMTYPQIDEMCAELGAVEKAGVSFPKFACVWMAEFLCARLKLHAF